jgi:hypothetical protein
MRRRRWWLRKDSFFIQGYAAPKPGTVGAFPEGVLHFVFGDSLGGRAQKQGYGGRCEESPTTPKK